MPVFQPNEIHVQVIRQFQPCYSAGLIACIEAHIPEDEKNNYARPAPGIDTVEDVLLVLAAAMENTVMWMQSPAIAEWRNKSRLDGFATLMANADMTAPNVAQAMGSIMMNGTLSQFRPALDMRCIWMDECRAC